MPRLAFFLLLLAGVLLALPAYAADGNKKGPVHNFTQSPSYLRVEPIYTTIMDGNRTDGLLLVDLGLDVPDPQLRAEVDHAMPVLRDLYLRSLMSFTVSTVRYWRQPDVVEIADRLQRATDLALKRPGARILLTQVAMRLTH